LPECGDSDISLPSLKSALDFGREGPSSRWMTAPCGFEIAGSIPFRLIE
jgi:hypothetical protein